MARIRLSHVTAVAAGGAIGASLRVALSERFPAMPGGFPLATFAQNVAGALLLGVLLVVLRSRLQSGQTLYLVACTGILGSFTTFSTFSVELVDLVREGSHAVAIAYPLASIAAGLAAAFAGMRGARWLARPREGPADG